MKVCLTPHLQGVGGMVSFQYKLSEALQRRGVQVTYDLADLPYQSVLIIGGTRQVAGLWRARLKGARLVQRLDGMNWLQRVRRPGHPGSGVRHYLRAEYSNLLLLFIRNGLAHTVVYQSNFARRWWESVYHPARVPCRVIYNGVDLNVYSPDGPGNLPQDRWRILLVEGSLMGGYEMGLEAAFALGVGLARKGNPSAGAQAQSVELQVVGRVAPAVQQAWNERAARADAPGFSLSWSGLVPRTEIPTLDRSAHMLYSADLNAACPNSVIEALACGLPVLAFDTGALPELVPGGAGRIVPYGGDPWRLDPPEMKGLLDGAISIIESGLACRQAARQRAEAAFDLESMVDQYLDVLAS